MDDKELEQLVRRVLVQIGQPVGSTTVGTTAGSLTQDPPLVTPDPQAPSDRPRPSAVVDAGEIPDVRAVDYRQTYAVPNADKPDEFRRIKARTWARLGLGRSGPRYTTSALLRFWADNAAAMDAVFTDVSQDFIDRLGLFAVQTRCTSKDEYLTRPDLGAQFDEAAIAEIVQRCSAKPQVQIYVADGLSSTAVESNVSDLLPALSQGLELHGLAMGTPFFVKYGRVRSMEPISEALGATVTCVLLGERPGLASAESLSAYLAFRATVGMSESDRTCVSNIHTHGTNAVEAGAHIADIIHQMIRQQTSGINLKL